MSGADAAQLLPALDQASHSLPARRRFTARVGPARLAGEFRVGDSPQPRLAGAMLILADAAMVRPSTMTMPSVPGAESGKVRRHVIAPGFMASTRSSFTCGSLPN